MSLLLALLLTAGANTRGDPGILVRESPGMLVWQPSNAKDNSSALACSFGSVGAYATGSTALCAYKSGTALALSGSRSTAATYYDAGGTLQTAGVNELRIDVEGSLHEYANSNYVLNSGTHPKTTEATASLSNTASYIAWHDGTGDMTVAAGTGTATGLPCTVSPGTLCSFTMTGTGTVLVTTTAGAVRAQIENASSRSSYIPSDGTAGYKSYDDWYLAPSGIPYDPFCVTATVRYAQHYIGQEYPIAVHSAGGITWTAFLRSLSPDTHGLAAISVASGATTETARYTSADYRFGMKDQATGTTDTGEFWSNGTRYTDAGTWNMNIGAVDIYLITFNGFTGGFGTGFSTHVKNFKLWSAECNGEVYP